MAFSLVHLVVLLACASPALALCRRRSLLADESSSSELSGTFPLFGGPAKLTGEQASELAGVWKLDSEEDQRRLDGSLYEIALKEALEAGGSLDLQEVMADALAQSSSLSNFKLIIPSVDAQSGLFIAYRVLMNVTSSAAGAPQPGQKFPDVKRIIGYARGLPCGSIAFQGAENVDTATYYGLVPEAEGGEIMELLRIEGIEVWDTEGKRTLDDQSIVQIRLAKVDGPQEMEEALASLASSLPLKPLRDDKAVS
ncbi:expressed protein [Chlorella variabilis]|uniref:Expressed protein n=1 Tax=Chlorella variabilis TaxID=554065 RepID=E1ZQ96_CHLVA|nr:expressed protein [Chlorella variabilis]EFN51983.1 expressed protein [Chlorella variabilis]|eukprot:XP_005844085.1 expressed protein [Chlorella variabilis]